MTLPLVIFYVFAALAIVSSLMVITQNNPVKCVLFLVVTFFATSVLWLLAEAEFLSLILVLVYVGAVMTLFLFVVMMLNIDSESMKQHFQRYLPFGLILVAVLVGLMVSSLPGTFTTNAVEQLSQSEPVVQTSANDTIVAQSNTEQLGMKLFTDYVYPFEVAACILLVAIIAAITLTHRTRKRSKQQDILSQLMTQKSDRLTIISMPSQGKS